MEKKNIDTNVGYDGGMNQLLVFINHRLKKYAALRNDPLSEVLSDLSAWFHFGHIAPQRAGLY